VNSTLFAKLNNTQAAGSLLLNKALAPLVLFPVNAPHFPSSIRVKKENINLINQEAIGTGGNERLP
jgi:hypothetical protein